MAGVSVEVPPPAGFSVGTRMCRTCQPSTVAARGLGSPRGRGMTTRKKGC